MFSEFPLQPVITCCPSPPPPCALWGRKRSSSDVLYGPSRLGRNQDVLLGAGMIVSALAGRFVSLQVISWMDNDRYTFPAIFRFCRRGSEKHGIQWPRGHLCKQAPKVSRASDRVRQRHIQPVSHKTSQWPPDLRLEVGVGFGQWWLQTREMDSGWWGNIEEATLDFWRVWWTLMDRRSRRMRGWWCGRRGTGRRGNGRWRVAGWLRSFFWFMIFQLFLTV